MAPHDANDPAFAAAIVLFLNEPDLAKMNSGKTVIFEKNRIAVLILVLLTVPLALFAQTGKYATVNGMKMYYEVCGEGDPLIVLHGAYMNIPSMGEIIPKLANTHRVYALEFQGHGRTNDIDRPITYPNLADDVAAFDGSCWFKKADVFGYSMGAEAGLQFVIRHPE